MSATATFDEQQQYVSVKTAAEILAMPERTVRYHCQKGRMPARKVGRAWRIPKSVVMPDDEEQ
jgi:excisionase family DNA binding protein